MTLSSTNWRLDRGFPALARMPGPWPWRLAARMGHEPLAQARRTRDWLASEWASLFPQATTDQRMAWAHAHMDMLAEEKLDAMALHRLGTPNGPAIEMEGLELAQNLHRQGQGFILVVAHYDRVLAAPVALARHGIHSSILTMPVANNPELDAANRRFLLRKTASYAQQTGGQWRHTDESLRPIAKGLQAGEVWVIFADGWATTYRHMRDHAFLGGWLNLPTGIERLARATGAPLVHATTYTLQPDRLKVVLRALPSEPFAAIDAVVAQLDHDVAAQPWAWWHWGMRHLMWRSEPLDA